jgi:PemK-like, MazF-like toxin of type II toxin-antitoxin system
LAKLRPVLLLCKTPGDFDDWLVCMISSQLHQAQVGFDEIIQISDEDYSGSGLKSPSVFRLSRLAVVESTLLTGSIGRISSQRTREIRQRISRWIASEQTR